MTKATINLAPLIDVLFITLLVMMGKQSEEVEKEDKLAQAMREAAAEEAAGVPAVAAGGES